MPKEVFEEEKKALGVRLDELIAQGENLQKNMKVLFLLFFSYFYRILKHTHWVGRKRIA